MRPSWLNMMAFCPEHPKWDQNPKFIPLSKTTSVPTTFICGVPPPPGFLPILALLVWPSTRQTSLYDGHIVPVCIRKSWLYNKAKLKARSANKKSKYSAAFNHTLKCYSRLSIKRSWLGWHHLFWNRTFSRVTSVLELDIVTITQSILISNMFQLDQLLITSFKSTPCKLLIQGSNCLLFDSHLRKACLSISL